MKRIIILFTALTGLVLTGCKKDFLDINNNPNQAVSTNIDPSLILPGVLSNMAGRVGTGYGFLNNWMGHHAPSGSFSSNTEETTYNITTGFATGQWTGWFDLANDAELLRSKAKELGMEMYEGMAKIMKSFAFQQLVDQYNNVPYSKAFDLAGNIRPGYDDGRTIYNTLLNEINDGINLIKNADANKNTNVDKSDIMFGNSDATVQKAKWARFGNTLKLRLLIHMSQVAGFSPAAEIARIQAEGSGFLLPGENADVNPGFVTDRPAPFWSTYMFNIQGQASNTFFRANNFVLGQMQSLSDPRIPFFFKPVTSTAFPPNTYRGVDYGLPPLTSNTQDRLSNIGGADAPGSAPKGIGKAFNMRSWLITSFEARFLVAEAIQRGWLAGNAQTAYEDAVRESFRWLLVPGADAAANTYMAQANVKTNWATATDKLGLISWQKYYALCGIDGLETWTEVRRLEKVVPPLSVAPGRTSGSFPVRLLYPQAEYNFNTSNVNAQGTISQFTSKVFWDQ